MIEFEAFSPRNVPEGHKGLHGFLYGEGGAEVHGVHIIPKLHSCWYDHLLGNSITDCWQ